MGGVNAEKSAEAIVLRETSREHPEVSQSGRAELDRQNTTIAGLRRVLKPTGGA
jgi:hypothetical protein